MGPWSSFLAPLLLTSLTPYPNFCVLDCSVVSNSLLSHGLQPARLLGPRNFPGKNIWMGCHFLFQGIFPTQGSNPHHLCLLPWQAGSLSLASPGSPGVQSHPWLFLWVTLLILVSFAIWIGWEFSRRSSPGSFLFRLFPQFLSFLLAFCYSCQW